MSKFPVFCLSAISVYLSFRHYIILSIVWSFCPSFRLSIHPPSAPLSFTDILFILLFLNSLIFSFLTSVLGRISPPPLPCFSHVCRLSLFSPSFSIFLSLSLLCWSLWLILKGNRESEWDLKEREELCSTQQGRPSLDWNAAREKKQHTGEESFSLSILFSFLHLSALLFYHSWVVWYLTFTLLQQGLGSKSSERRLVSPLSYSVIPPISIPSSSLFLTLLLFLPVFKQTITVRFFLPYRAARGKIDVEIPWQTPTFLPIMYRVRRLLHRLLSLMWLYNRICCFFCRNYWLWEVKSLLFCRLKDSPAFQIQSSFVI